MGRRREGLSVAREIDGLEEKLAHCRQSIEEVDLKLRREKLSSEGRKSLERERNLLMTKADNYETRARESDLSLKSCRPQQNECPGSDLSHTHPSGAQGNPDTATFKEKELSVLRKENRKNAALAVAMALLIALIYACWTM